MANTSPQAKMLTQIGLLRGHCTRPLQGHGSAQQHTSPQANVYDVARLCHRHRTHWAPQGIPNEPLGVVGPRRGAVRPSFDGLVVTPSARPSFTAKHAIGCYWRLRQRRRHVAGICTPFSGLLCQRVPLASLLLALSLVGHQTALVALSSLAVVTTPALSSQTLRHSVLRGRVQRRTAKLL